MPCWRGTQLRSDFEFRATMHIHVALSNDATDLCNNTLMFPPPRLFFNENGFLQSTNKHGGLWSNARVIVKIVLQQMMEHQVSYKCCEMSSSRKSSHEAQGSVIRNRLTCQI